MKTTWIITIALLLIACSSGGGDDFVALACDPGETQACVCDSGDDGAQECKDSGKGWDECECEAAGTGGTSGAGGSSGSSGTGGSSGTAGTGGADSKECEVDSDCPTTAQPYCIEWECEYRLQPNSDCGPNFGGSCPPGYDCTTLPCAPGYKCTEIGTGYVPQCKPE